MCKIIAVANQKGGVGKTTNLHEAGLVGKTPSGTSYTDGNGHTVINLGVHEHWNNSTEKLYSRNLGKDEGIELIQIGY